MKKKEDKKFNFHVFKTKMDFLTNTITAVEFLLYDQMPFLKNKSDEIEDKIKDKIQKHINIDFERSFERTERLKFNNNHDINQLKNLIKYYEDNKYEIERREKIELFYDNLNSFFKFVKSIILFILFIKLWIMLVTFLD